MSLLVLALTILAAALASAALCVLLRPLLLRYALARPNARSSHKVPTPQGGGIAVLAGAMAASAGALCLAAPPAASQGIAVVFAAVTALALVGAWDDIRPLSPALRLVLQALCVGAVLFLAAPDLRLFPELLPLPVERLLALLAGLWFVNLVNFIDGLDWITVAALMPLSGALVLLGAAGGLDPGSAALAAGLCGGLLGFAPFNRPVARLFLGDVGSLPLGLLTAWLLYRLAETGAFAAALILPLYSVTDATVTLVRRLLRGEKVWQAHRSHFYQQATTNGFSVLGAVGRIAALNLALIAIAGVSLAFPSLPAQALCLLAALGSTAWLMRLFARGPEHG